MGGFDIVLELALLGLLAATLLHAVRLQRSLSGLRTDRSALQDAVDGFDGGTRQAEAALGRLQVLANALGAQHERSQSLRDDLAFLSERGESLADRLDLLVRAARTLAPAPQAAPTPPMPQPSPPSRTAPQPGGAQPGRRLARSTLMRRLAAPPRLLPWLIAVMAVLAAVKLVSLALDFGSPLLSRAGRAMVPPAVAAGHGAAEPKPAAAQPPPPPPAPVPEPPDPGPSAAERAVLMDLRSRRTALDERAKTLDAREAVLAAAERRLSERVQQLASLQTRLEALDQNRRERDEANWRSLVKTYETMRPRDAAAILNDLDQPVMIQVLDRMKEAKAAPILAAMLPERARAATAELAKWRNRTVEPQG